MRVPTVKVIRDGVEVIINQSAYRPDRDQLAGEKKPVKKTAGKKAKK